MSDLAAPVPSPESQPSALRLSADFDRAELRKSVLRHLRAQGFHISENERSLLVPVNDSKVALRGLHSEAVEAQLSRSRSTLERLEGNFIRRLIDGADLDPRKIRPALRLLPAGDHHDAKLWRWAALHWSVPVSSGYGRRLRFLVVDEGHDDAVMGLIGLADPVFALAARDAAIGWDLPARRARLANVMDAYVLGAVPPYSMLLGGKLMGLLLASDGLRTAFESRYSDRPSRILGRTTNAQLALVTTSSALGRSSIYNRVRREDGSTVMEAVGYTRGSGDFHFSGEIYEQLTLVAQHTLAGGATHRNARWGDGFRNRREVVQRALRELGLSPTNFRLHGVRRQVFLTDVATNSREWLASGAGELHWRDETSQQLGAWWRERWAEPRARSQIDWSCFDRRTWRLWADS